LLEARARAARVVDRVQWELTKEEIASVEAELADARQRERDLTIVSPVDGVFNLAAAQDLPDRFLRKGQPLGYVLPETVSSVRLLVSQDDVGLVRSQTERVRVKLAGRLYETYDAVILREVPGGSYRLPNMALSSSGGGVVAVDPRATNEPKALERWFEFELNLPENQLHAVGVRAYVRFEHGSEPIAWRFYRSVRQLFMKRFSV